MAVPEDVDGVPLDELVFEDIEWTDGRREHVEQRASRKRTDEYAPRVEWATEACADVDRLVGRTASAIVVVGRSRSAGRVLHVVLAPRGHAGDGTWWGLTARGASQRERRQHEEGL